MEAKLVRLEPLIILLLVMGFIGFFAILGWWKLSGREIDRSTILFFAKIVACIVFGGIVFAFIA